ncbi:MAG: 16S rRNA (guanine(527)-N(7))-methyltransferase RsmG, partial [Gammaproteobacteria bacterium]|nr:16S rRNA (guanine(527)-N(7))-methyltransferase RsmG [Gammaproteobacteria bacterium]
LKFIDLLDKWNKAYNLTAIRNKHDMLFLHILDSLSLLPHLAGSRRILDVGSGAGLPGIPLAILEPDRVFVLLDSNGKKTRFIKQAIIELKLKNVTVVHDRIEKYSPEENFDCITTRAFATISETIDMIEHFLLKEARILFMKSNTTDDELAKIESDYNKNVITLNVPGIDAPRTLAILTKQ